VLGAVAGDVIGSVHEGGPPQSKAFLLFTPRSRFTDDTVLTVAIGNAILTASDYGAALQLWGRRYPGAGYGGFFRDWLASADPRPYNSYGNGSAMRVSAIGWAFDDLPTVMAEARRSAEVTHNHPEGIKGAQAVAGAVFLARTGHDKARIREFLCDSLEYDCSPTLDELRSRASFDVTCQGTVPSAAVAFFESADFEDSLRNAVSLGGDADTLACITGAIAEAFYGETPADIQREVIRRLDVPLRRELFDFARVYGVPVRPDLSGEGETQ
jgi:ADP-ribosylglycohydrolase